MSTKPILFNTDMVRAILAGRKTVTRRVVKPRFCDSVFEMFRGQLYEASPDKPPRNNGDGTTTRSVRAYVPCKAPYRPGDILYVRETFGTYIGDYYLYRADYPDGAKTYDYDGYKCNLPRWRPSIHMPREAARIFLRVIDVRAERLQDSFFKHGNTIFYLQREGIDIGEQCRECIDTYGSPICNDSESECGILDEVRGDFSDLWDSTLKPADRALYGWAANPWVWVIEFERVSREEANL